MGYSLRTRSASKSEVEAPKKTVAVSKPAAKKAAAPKKIAAPKKAEKKTEIKKETEPKKAVQAKNTAVEAKKAAPAKPTVKKATAKPAAKKAAPAKAQVKKAVEKEVVSKKVDTKVSEVKKVAAKKTEVKKVAAKKTEVKKAPAKAKAKKAESTKASPAKKATKSAAKPVVKKASAPKKTAAPKIIAPVVSIEEVSTPSLPDTEPILHSEPEEKIIEIVEGQAISTHIRFSEDGTEDVEMKQSPKAKIIEEEPKAESPLQEDEIVEYPKDASITSSDFEALNDISEEPNHFELYNSESETEEVESVDQIVKDEFDEEEVKKESPVTNAHSAFDAFTSHEEPKTFNWNNSGSTYYQKNEEKPVEESKPVESPAPTVISNPFGFGFTTTTASTATVTSAPASVATSRPNPFSFNSHFQSVSSPLDKLCTLTSKANPIQVAGSSSFNFGTSSMGTSSFLPTSPAVGLSKAARSPSEKGDDREERSPSVIQSIIIDDKHEDFSAF